jgi:MinD-like ATPase involved in chromosome partitioning or flagellar assembly
VSINQGTPLMVDNPTHPVSRAIRELAETHLSTPIAATQAAGGIPESRANRKKPFSLRRGR